MQGPALHVLIDWLIGRVEPKHVPPPRSVASLVNKLAVAARGLVHEISRGHHRRRHELCMSLLDTIAMLPQPMRGALHLDAPHRPRDREYERSDIFFLRSHTGVDDA